MPRKAQQILKTAERLFAGSRYHEVTLDEICSGAGVGKGTVYRYFKDKEDLYYQVILSGLDELVEKVEQVGAAEQDPSRGLPEVASRVARFFTERKALFGLMWSEQLRGSTRKKTVWKQWRKKTERMLAVLADFIERGTERGLYRTPFPPQAAARLLLGMIRVGIRHRREMPGGKDWPLSIARLFERGILDENARKSRK